MSQKYITTTLPYVNADPHIGFAYEIVEADALSRYWRSQGHDVFFNTGTDEHGQKIAQKADEKGISRQAYVDHYAGEFLRLKEGLNLSFDAFIRTTEEKHVRAAQEIWKRCDLSGDIYKKKYSGFYCVGCESFKTEADLVEGKCPEHQKAPEHIEEENYFFRLSKYQTYLEEYLSQEGAIEPEWRRQEALTFVKKGLEDFSISREKVRLDWGIPVPGDDDQVMYVWFDALTNYISTLDWPEGENFEKFWKGGETLQVAGKDQVRFQSIMWQAMLKSAGLPATKKVLYHGFITSGGQKMSKTIGNVISPYELIERYGTDATRYLLLRHVHPFEDTDITWERLDEWYTANLVNGIGNLTSRIMKMAETYLTEGLDETNISAEDKSAIYSDHYTKPFDDLNIHDAINLVWLNIQTNDEYIADTEPFKVIKSDVDAGKTQIKFLREGLYLIACRLKPIMPQTAETILIAIRENKKPENLFPRLT